MKNNTFYSIGFFLPFVLCVGRRRVDFSTRRGRFFALAKHSAFTGNDSQLLPRNSRNATRSERASLVECFCECERFVAPNAEERRWSAEEIPLSFGGDKFLSFRWRMRASKEMRYLQLAATSSWLIRGAPVGRCCCAVGWAGRRPECRPATRRTTALSGSWVSSECCRTDGDWGTHWRRARSCCPATTAILRTTSHPARQTLCARKGNNHERSGSNRRIIGENEFDGGDVATGRIIDKRAAEIAEGKSEGKRRAL